MWMAFKTKTETVFMLQVSLVSFLEHPFEKSLRPDADSETKGCQDLFIMSTGHNSVVIVSMMCPLNSHRNLISKVIC